MRDCREFTRLPGELLVNLAQLLHAVRAYQHIQRYIEEVIPTRTFDRPALAQKLAWLQNLLANNPRIRRAISESLKVLLRVA